MNIKKKKILKFKNMRIILVILTIIIILVAFPFIKNLSSSHSLVSDEVLFDNIGHYAFATAGNNNAYRGTSIAAQDYTWIESYPDSVDVDYDWNTVKQNLANEGITSFSNMSGSYLNADGKIKKAIMSNWASGTSYAYYSGRVLIIKPNGNYVIYNADGDGYGGELDDITSYMQNEGKGWYFVSFLDAILYPQTSWGITVVYENENLPDCYIKLINVSQNIANGQEINMVFNSRYELKNKFQLIGTILSGGTSAFPYEGETEDIAYAKLIDGTEYQLYDREDGHFTERTNTDFANGIFNTRRSHNIKGGELDIFDESLESSYFGGKQIIGYRFKKVGRNIINISLVGLKQEILSPNMAITTSMSPNTNFSAGTAIKTTTTAKNNLQSDGTCAIAYNSVITNSVHNDLSNITNINATYNGTVLSSRYDSLNRKIIVDGLNNFECEYPIVITYDATVNESIENHVTNNRYNLDTTANIDYYVLEDDEYKLSKTAKDNISSLKKVVVTVKYIDKNNNNQLEEPTYINSTYGSTYEASPIEIEGYSLYEVNGNATGTLTNDIEVVFYYKKDIKVTVNHYVQGTTTPIKLANGNNATSEVQNKHEGDSYTTSELANKAEYYELVSTPSNAEGTVGSSNIVVTYYYKLKGYTYTVNYLDKDTNQSIHTSKTGSATYQQTINSSNEAIAINKYTYDSADKETLTIGTSSNVINLYYTKNTGKVIVKYYNKITNTEISGVTRETITGKVDSSYNTASKKKTIEGYDYDSSSNNTEGTITETDIEVIYYYKKKVTVTVNHYVQGTTTPIKLANGNNATSEVQNKHEGDSYTTSELANKAEYYELVSTPSNAEGTVGSSNIVVKYYYRLKNYDYAINYIDKNTNESISDSITGELPYSSSINANDYIKEINKYTYDSTDNETLTISNNSENIMNLYYIKKKGKLIVKYIDKYTNEEIISKDETIEKVDTPYETSAKTKSGYTKVEDSGNTSGNYTIEDIIVVYKYAKNVKLTVNYIDEVKNSLIEKIEENCYQGKGYRSVAKNYEGYVLISSPEEPEGIFEREDITLNYYYKEISGGILEKHVDEYSGEILYNYHHTGNENDPYNIGSREFAGYDLDQERIPSNATGRMKVELEEVVYYYRKKANITIKYLDENTNNELTNEETQNGYVNDEWTSTLKEIEGYEIVREPEEKEGRLDYQNEDIIYYYRKKLYVKTAIKNDEGGTIEGDEKVLEGNNSTPEKIVIKPDSNHYIEKVTINDEEIPVTNIELMILDNFIDMHEDKIIAVTFGEKIINVPKTANNTVLFVFAGVMSLFGAGITYLGLNKKKKVLG